MYLALASLSSIRSLCTQVYGLGFSLGGLTMERRETMTTEVDELIKKIDEAMWVMHEQMMIMQKLMPAVKLLIKDLKD